MNYISFIAKIIDEPKERSINDNISVLEVLVKFAQIRNTNFEIVIKLKVWGNLRYDFLQYYRINDYIIIEGYISIHENLISTVNKLKNKQIEVSVCKIYPFSLDSSANVNK